MSPDSTKETLSIAEVAELVVTSTGEKLAQVTVALLCIVKTLKQQPNFDVDAFNAKIVESARMTAEPEESMLRAILLSAADQDIPEE